MKRIGLLPSQLIAVVLALMLVIGLFLFGKRVDPHKDEKALAQKEKTIESFDFESYIDKVKDKMDSSQTLAIKSIEDSVGNTSFLNIKPRLLEHLASKWELANHPDIAANYLKQIAEIEATSENWIKAGDEFSAAFLMGGDSLDMTLRGFLASSASESYQKAVSIDTSNLDAKVRLGGSYIDGATGTEDVMKGVQILLAVVAKDPENEQANLVLGRSNIVNGQYDKAVSRLETVVKVNPKNAEAWFHLGEANRALGNKDRAIECFEKFKVLANDPAISKQVDAYIDKIKNGG